MISTEQAAALAEAAEKVARTVPGVDTLYPVGGSLARLVESAVQAAGLAPAPCPVEVDVAETVTVRISVGTDATVGAGEVARRVAETVMEVFRAGGFDDPLVHLTVARVSEPLPPPTAGSTELLVSSG